MTAVMSTRVLEPAFASGIDAFRFGEHRSSVSQPSAFIGRLGTRTYPALAQRYHLYASWVSPAAHRLTILRALHELVDVVSVSYVDGRRDARGWAFREGTGPDPINGFTMLREAYESSRPDYQGEIRVPLLWDVRRAEIVSDEARTMGIDLATAFSGTTSFSHSGSSGTYSLALADEIEAVGRWLDAEIIPAAAVYDPVAAARLRRALRTVDDRLESRSYVLGDQLTDADVRLWVQLARLDAGPNAHGMIGPRLDHYPNVWRWAAELYKRPAFGDTTRFEAFTAPFADVPPWR